MSLVRAYERCAQFAQPTSSTPTRRPWRTGSASYNTASSSVPSTTNPMPTDKTPLPHRTLSLAEMERRHAAGLCYYCEEKFVRGHSCKLFVLEIDPVMDYEDDHDTPVRSDPEISLAVVTGIQPQSGQTMHIMVLINNRPLAALASGLTHNFIAESVVWEAALSLQPRSDLWVTVANGNRVVSSGVCRNLTICVGTEAFSPDCYTIPLEGFDVILGVQWLGTLGPIVWDFSNMSGIHPRRATDHLARHPRGLPADLCPRMYRSRLDARAARRIR